MIESKAEETAFVDLGAAWLAGHLILEESQVDRVKLSRTCQNLLVLTETDGDDNAKATYVAVWKMFADEAAIKKRCTAEILEELLQHISVYKSKLSMWSRLWRYVW